MCQAYEAEARFVTKLEHEYGSIKAFFAGGPKCKCPDYPYEVDRENCPVHNLKGVTSCKTS